MGDFLKKNTVTLLIIAATLILAGVAVFTAIRLYQLRSTAPTAPRAGVGNCGVSCSSNAQCTGGTVCSRFDSKCRNPYCETKPGNCDPMGCTAVLTECGAVGCAIGQSLCTQGTCDTSTNIGGVCNCNVASPTPTPSASASASPGGVVTIEGCSLEFTLAAGATPTPTPTPGASPTPSPTPTPTPTPSGDTCNDSCSSDSDCSSGQTCTGNRCRNTQCTDETDCTCAVAASTAPELPDAGISIPTLLGGAAGVLLILGALLLAL